MLFSFLYKRLLAILFNPLSQDGRVVATPPPPHFRVFPRAVFAFSLRLPIGQFTYPLSRYHAGPSPPERSEERRKNGARTGLDTHVSIKIFRNTTRLSIPIPPPHLPPEREGVEERGPS